MKLKLKRKKGKLCVFVIFVPRFDRFFYCAAVPLFRSLCVMHVDAYRK